MPAKVRKITIYSIFVLVMLITINNISVANSNIIYSNKNKNDNGISPVEKELHNWIKIGDNQYEVYNMFFDEFDSNGNLIQQNNYYRYTMDKNKIEENYKISIDNKIADLISNEDKIVLHKNFKNYYKTIYTQADFNMLNKEELTNVNKAFTNAFKTCKNHLAKENFRDYHLSEIQENFHYLKLNYMLSRWTLENYDENIYNNATSIKKYDSQFLDILKHHNEFDEDQAVKQPIDDYFGGGHYEFIKNIGFYNVKSNNNLIDGSYYEIDVNTLIRVQLENNMINKLNVGDKIKIYRYKKGIKDNIYFDFTFKGYVKYDDIFWKYDKNSKELKHNDSANQGYEYYKKFFSDNNVTKFAKFEWDNYHDDEIKSDIDYINNINIKDNFQYVAINENRFSAPLFNLDHISAQFYRSPFGQYELFYNINFSSDYKIRIMKNALLLDSGVGINYCITCFIGNFLNEKLELIDERNAMKDVSEKELSELFAYMYFNDKNYITCLINIAHSWGDSLGSYGQFNKPLMLDMMVKKGTKVYKDPYNSSEVVYTLETDIDSKNNDGDYEISPKNIFVDNNNDEWLKVNVDQNRPRNRVIVENGWIKNQKYEIKEQIDEEYWTWYPYSLSSE